MKKVTDRDILMDVIRRPREHRPALVWTGASAVFVAVALVLELFK